MVPLRGPHEWATTTIAHGTADVEIVRLHADPDMRTSVSLVRFPPGWQRSIDGHYDVHEEIVIIDGQLELTGVTYGPSDYGFVPMGGLRRETATPEGCIALAWFGGVPAWTSSPDDDPQGECCHVALGDLHAGAPGRLLRQSGEGSCWLTSGTADGAVADVDTEIVDLTAWAWAWTSVGDTLPPIAGPVLVRRWSSDPG